MALQNTGHGPATGRSSRQDAARSTENGDSDALRNPAWHGHGKMDNDMQDTAPALDSGDGGNSSSGRVGGSGGGGDAGGRDPSDSSEPGRPWYIGTVTDMAPVIALLVSILVYSKLKASRRGKHTISVPAAGLEQSAGADADLLLGGEAATGQRDGAAYSSAEHWLSGDDGPLSKIRTLLPHSKKESAASKLRWACQSCCSICSSDESVY